MVFSGSSGMPCKPDRLTKEIRRTSDTINSPDMDARSLRHAFAGERINSYMNGLESLSENFDAKSDANKARFEENQRLY